MDRPKVPLSFLKDIQADVKFRSEAFQVLLIYSKFTFYLLMSPLKLVISDVGTLIVQSNLLHKVTCLLANIMAVTECTYRMVTAKIVQNSIKDNPSQLYGITSTFCMVSGIFMLLCITWRKQDGLSCMYESTYKVCRRQTTKIPFTKLTVLMAIICGAPVFEAAGICYHYTSIAVKAFQGVPDDIATFSTISLIPLYANGTEDDGPSKIAVATYILRAASSIYATMFTLYFTVLPSVCFVVVHQIGNDFDKFLLMNPSVSFEQISEAYVELKLLLSNINRCTGKIMLISIIFGITNLSQYFSLILDSSNLYFRIRLLWHFGVFIGTLALAADANCKFQEIAEYIFGNRKLDTYRDNLEMSVLLTEISRNQLGLKAHTFTITYSFMTTILSTSLTYVIILLQFQTSQK